MFTISKAPEIPDIRSVPMIRENLGWRSAGYHVSVVNEVVSKLVDLHLPGKLSEM